MSGASDRLRVDRDYERRDWVVKNAVGEVVARANSSYNAIEKMRELEKEPSR